MEEAKKVDLQSQDITQETLEQLKQLIPSAFKEGKVDFDALKTVLGDVVEPSREFYNFTWAGKSEAFRILQKPSTATLKPDKDESVDFENTENIFIEGDNLEVLKLLQKTYHDKIKMIYIDPPYNKDKDFVYPDRWSEGIKSYKEYCNFVDDDGNITTTDDEATNATGRKHSRWLTMMYPRLFLARNLLKEDGVIFISIDDDEVKNLRMICDEIFGEENFVASSVWQKRYSRENRVAIGSAHEYILIYAKSHELFQNTWNKIPLGQKQLKVYKNPNNDSRGKWRGISLSAQGYRPNQMYKITSPITGKSHFPPEGSCWKVVEQEYKRLLADNRIYFGKDGNAIPQRIQFLSSVKGLTPWTWWTHEECGHTDESKKEIQTLFGTQTAFDTPKPLRLLNRILHLATKDNDIILDFFAGSGTTAHAIMALNAEDGGNRQSISVQLPEPIDEKNGAYKTDYKTISQITKERIRRAGKKIKEENPDKNIDIGFKVFKLDESNFKQWDKDITDGETLKQTIMEFENNVEEGSDKLNMLYELLLKKGLDLNSKIEKVNIVDNEIFIVGSGMYVCMDDKISEETIDKVIEARPVHFIVLDKAFEGNDQLKTNTFQTFKTLYQDSENPFETV